MDVCARAPERVEGGGAGRGVTREEVRGGVAGVVRRSDVGAELDEPAQEVLRAGGAREVERGASGVRARANAARDATLQVQRRASTKATLRLAKAPLATRAEETTLGAAAATIVVAAARGGGRRRHRGAAPIRCGVRRRRPRFDDARENRRYETLVVVA